MSGLREEILPDLPEPLRQSLLIREHGPTRKSLHDILAVLLFSILSSLHSSPPTARLLFALFQLRHKKDTHAGVSSPHDSLSFPYSSYFTPNYEDNGTITLIDKTAQSFYSAQ